MQDYFYTLAGRLLGSVRGSETLLLNFAGECSDFIRFNQAKVRQAGTVTRRRLTLDLIEAERHATGQAELTGLLADDLQRLSNLLETLRSQREHLPKDPYLHVAVDGESSERSVASDCPARDAALDAITSAADGLDLVGIFAAGNLNSGFANSNGQRNWHTSASFNFDWSCFNSGDKAVKANYAGLHWAPDDLARRMAQLRDDLALLGKPPRTIAPGSYRVFLAPRALQEVLEMMAWGGFGLKSQRTGQSPLIRLQKGDVRLDPAVSISENNARGLAAHFTPQGFSNADRVPLINNGKHAAALIDARSAAEFGAMVNAAGEWPSSMEMAPGNLASRDVLASLGTGLFINNLWYLNYSDRNEARITGMTRFACFWVENGRIQAPVNVMRFDDSIYRLLGERLLGLTVERELLLDTGTYGGRSISSSELPGALIDDVRFTL
jgi:predicted Zn-dependent protease